MRVGLCHPWKQKLVEAYRCPDNHRITAWSFLFEPEFKIFVRDKIPDPDRQQERQRKSNVTTLSWWIIALQCESHYYLSWFFDAQDNIRNKYRGYISMIHSNAFDAAGFSFLDIHYELKTWLLNTYLFEPLQKWPGLLISPKIMLWKPAYRFQQLIDERIGFFTTYGHVFLQTEPNEDFLTCQETGQTVPILHVIKALKARARDMQNMQLLFQGTKSPKSSIFRHFVQGNFAERQVLGLIRQFLLFPSTTYDS